jgi:hypothetical protein
MSHITQGLYNTRSQSTLLLLPKLPTITRMPFLLRGRTSTSKLVILHYLLHHWITCDNHSCRGSQLMEVIVVSYTHESLSTPIRGRSAPSARPCDASAHRLDRDDSEDKRRRWGIPGVSWSRAVAMSPGRGSSEVPLAMSTNLGKVGKSASWKL